MDFSENIIGFHGTSQNAIYTLLSGNIDVFIGGGELGRGFYLSDRLHIAKAWAWNRYRGSTVPKVEVKDADFFNLQILPLDWQQAGAFRREIKIQQATRTYTFGSDVVWAPILGGSKVYSDQYKWESDQSETLLNSSSVLRSVV